MRVAEQVKGTLSHSRSSRACREQRFHHIPAAGIVLGLLWVTRGTLLGGHTSSVMLAGFTAHLGFFPPLLPLCATCQGILQHPWELLESWSGGKASQAGPNELSYLVAPHTQQKK